MDNEAKKRVAERFLRDDKPCDVSKKGLVHELPEKYKVVKVDKFSFEKRD
jgi:hypothetical protein